MKKIGWTLLAAALVALLWYIFIRSHEFEVNFNSKTLPGDIIQTIRIWDKSREDMKVVGVDSVFSLTQKVERGARSYLYHWNFSVLNDSITKVNIEITEPAESKLNKLLIPFTDQPIESDARDVVEEFYGILKTHLEITRVDIVGESETMQAFCVCRTIETSQTDKAKGMMRYYGLLTSFISDSNLEPAGPPILKIQEWDHAKGSVKFDFCFPIIKTTAVPASDSVSYKQFESEKALKAVYNGNYITSDRAWYALYHFAERNGYKTALPIEKFYDNPNLGLDEQKWRAEIFLPIRK